MLWEFDSQPLWDKQIAQLDRLAYPKRYRLSSGTELTRIFMPNYRNPSLHIWTKVGDALFSSANSYHKTCTEPLFVSLIPFNKENKLKFFIHFAIICKAQ